MGTESAGTGPPASQAIISSASSADTGAGGLHPPSR